MRPAAEVLESALIVGEVVVFEVDDTVPLLIAQLNLFENILQ